VAIAIHEGPGDYRAGRCNIGREEVAARRRIGLVQLAVAILLAVGLVALDTPPWMRLAVWPFLAAAFTTLEQVRRRFCVAFGMSGIRNFGPEVGVAHAERIEDAAARAADRRAALIMAGYCIVAAGALTALFVAVPV
jgi:hypothetical protein